MDTKLHYLLELTPEQMVYLLQAFTKGFDYYARAKEITYQRNDDTRIKIADEIIDELMEVRDVLEYVINHPEEYQGGCYNEQFL